MKRYFLLIALLSAFLAFGNLYAGKVIKVGNFLIAGTIHRKGFILDDGKIYKPVSHHQKLNTVDWQIGDLILLLHKKHKNRYILVNMRIGQKANMRQVSWKKV